MLPQPLQAKQTGSPLHHGATGMLIQPDWKVTDDGKGMLSGTLRMFFPHTSGEAGMGSYPSTMREGGHIPTVMHTGGNSLGYAKSNTTSLPSKGSQHPYDSRLFCSNFTVTYQGNDISYCDAEYVGIDGDPSGIEWELSCPTEENEISTHPRFLDVDPLGFNVVKQDGYDPETNGPFWNRDVADINEETQTFNGFLYTPDTIENKLAGVKSYKVMHPVFRISYSTMTVGTATKNLEKVGMIFAKPELAPDWMDFSGNYGSADEQQANYKDWLLTSVNISETSGIYKVQCEYTLSEEGGWNKIIYKDTATS